MYHHRLDLEYDLPKNYDGCRPAMASNLHRNELDAGRVFEIVRQALKNMVDNLDQWRQDLGTGSGGLQVNY